LGISSSQEATDSAETYIRDFNWGIKDVTVKAHRRIGYKNEETQSSLVFTVFERKRKTQEQKIRGLKKENIIGTKGKDFKTMWGIWTQNGKGGGWRSWLGVKFIWIVLDI